jgi:hypothetical protein
VPSLRLRLAKCTAALVQTRVHGWAGRAASSPTASVRVTPACSGVPPGHKMRSQCSSYGRMTTARVPLHPHLPVTRRRRPARLAPARPGSAADGHWPYGCAPPDLAHELFVYWLLRRNTKRTQRTPMAVRNPPAILSRLTQVGSSPRPPLTMLIADGRTTSANAVTHTPATIVAIARTPAVDLPVERPSPSEGGGREEGDVIKRP